MFKEPPEAALGPLIGQVRTALLGAIDRKLAPLELTAAQFSVVAHLTRGVADTPGELCRLMSYDRGAMTRLIDRIEAKGIVARVRCREDRRSVKLKLTDKGHALVPQLLPLVQEICENGLRDFLPEERERLFKDLNRLLAGLSSAG